MASGRATKASYYRSVLLSAPFERRNNRSGAFRRDRIDICNQHRVAGIDRRINCTNSNCLTVLRKRGT